MKYTYLKAHGYKGFFAKLGTLDIELDLSQCTHKIVLIEGENGYGKSTLINILHLMPDDSSSFIDGEPGYKELWVNDYDINYKACIKHNIKSNGSRDTTKAYLYRLNGDMWEDLNPNGNISSYKDLLYSIFGIDPNFIALSKISSENRGLVDKRPSERKMFFSSIISNIEVFNNMYKTLNKKSSIYKSNVNTITAKINQIGNLDQLQIRLSKLEQDLELLQNSKDNLIATISSDKSKIQLLDPNNEIQNTFNDIYKDIKLINNELKTNELNINTIKNKYAKDISLDKIQDEYIRIKQVINEINTSIQVYQSKINRTLQDRDDEAENLQIKSAKLESLKMETNYTDLKSLIKSSEEKISMYKDIIDKIGIKDINSISKDEFILGLNTLKEIKETIDQLYYTKDYNIVIKTIENIKNNTLPDLINIETELNTLNSRLVDLSVELSEYTTLSEVSKKIANRPKQCKIDQCLFIKDSLEAIKKNPDENISRIEKEINECKDRIEYLTTYKNDSMEIINTNNYINTIIRSIKNNNGILCKLPVDIDLFGSVDSILQAIEDKKDFKEIDILYEYLQYANIIEQYKSELCVYNKLKQDEQIYKAKNEIVDDVMEDINRIQSRMNNIQLEIDDYNNKIIELNTTSSKLQDTLVQYETLLKLIDKNNNLKYRKEDLVNRYETIKSKMAEIKISLDNINNNTVELSNINNRITPLNKERDEINHAMRLSREYAKELEVYSNMYNKIEILKKYSSPTKNGIQMLFIEMYMNKILSTANQLLGLLFNGEYMLKQPIINQSEFRLPCIGDRMECDDVSSMSTSQKCMIGMILSFSVLRHSNSRLNIASMDEIDGGLDHQNRLIFFPIVCQMIDILQLDQVFIISHNQEIDYSNCDVINLSNPQVNNILRI